jgi:hypothetical protein
MSKDPLVEYELSFPDHRLKVSTLIESLQKLNPDDILWPNMVHNLTVERDGKFIGYIDFKEGEMYLDDDGEEDEEE